MKVYQINYDLRKQRNYQALYDAIKAYGTWARPLESCWVIATNSNAQQIRDNLQRHIDQDDGLLVTRLQNEAAWVGLSNDLSTWLKQQLQQAA